MFRWILARYGVQLLCLAALRVWSPPVARRAAETTAYLLRRDSAAGSRAADSAAEVPAELLSIAVAADCRNRGVGRALLSAFEEFLRDQACRQYRVATDAEEAVSNAFYRGAGFTFRRRFQHHGLPMNEYVKAIGRT